MYPRPTGPAPSLTRLATVSQMSTPKTYTAMSDATLLFRLHTCRRSPISLMLGYKHTFVEVYIRPAQREAHEVGREVCAEIFMSGCSATVSW